MQKVDVVASTTTVLEELPETSLKACSLNYYLLQNTCTTDGAVNRPVYGIRVELLEMGKLVNSAELSDVTVSIERGKYLISYLSKNAVTPTSLMDVIEDFLAIEYDTDYNIKTAETA